MYGFNHHILIKAPHCRSAKIGVLTFIQLSLFGTGKGIGL